MVGENYETNTLSHRNVRKSEEREKERRRRKKGFLVSKLPNSKSVCPSSLSLRMFLSLTYLF
jgi:hypothetical protein